MPLEPYLRGKTWWAKGKVEDNGRPITSYIRESTGSPTKAGARDWIEERTNSERRRFLLGEEAEKRELTFMEAVILYPAKPKDGKFLQIVLPHIAEMPVSKITGVFIKEKGLEIYPNACTDTIKRQVLTPVAAVINHAHELGKCSPVKFKGYEEKERIARDKKRGVKSRVERKPSDLNWIERFCEYADPHNAALVRFMFETGARIDQAISLEPCDLDLANRKVTLKAQKGHDERVVTISEAMMIDLANLRPKRVLSDGEHSLRIFGYGTRTGYIKRWKTICKQAGIEYLSAHLAGRHGFYTHATEILGISSASAAKAGGWSSTRVPESNYRHAQGDEKEIREGFRTNPVQAQSDNYVKPLKIKDN